MAALRKKELSPYWFACFTLPDGRRVQRSTKERQRKLAQAKADEWEKLAKENAKARQAHRVIADIYKAAHQAELPDSTPQSFLEGWLARRKGEVSKSTFSVYSGRAQHFTEWLGSFATRPMAELEVSHFVRYRDELATRLAPRSANQAIKILRSIFEDARRDGLLADNPAKDCGMLKTTKIQTRRPFTPDEIAKALDVADDEWRSMILFGIYTGQRLGDIATLTWANVDPQAEEIHLSTAKTGRVVRVPICEPLAKHIESLSALDDPKAPLHPRASALAAVNNSTLSRQFADLLANAGLAKKRSHEAAKDGRNTKRGMAALSFHSLRHTATSLMKNAGISPAIVQDIIGHESAEISAHYTHVDTAAKRKAVDALPDFTQRK
jgi:integrase